jgi:hypothetical protein
MLLGMPALEWSPQMLFAAGEQGVWCDPSDRSTLWQDTAGTIPVTAPGQLVARVDDKSGRGNHATQAATGRQPLYQIDTTGRPYLEFDGVDDALRTASFDSLSTDALAVAGLFKKTGTGRRVVFEYGVAVASIGSLSLFSEGSLVNTVGARSRGSTNDREITSPAVVPPNTLSVMSGLYSTNVPRVQARLDGNLLAANAGVQGSVDYGPFPLFIGARNDASLRAPIHFYGGIVRFGTSLPSGVVPLVERWMARKTGVVF